MHKIQKEIDKLCEQLNYHNIRYYVHDDPSISDSEYDNLLRELQQLEFENPHLLKPNSPTQRVGTTPLLEFQSIKHRLPMLSLANAMDLGELTHFDEQIQKNLGLKNIKYVAEPKLDGLAVELVYENGIFTKGSTRGNGEIGEDITNNLKTIKAIPLKLIDEYKVPSLLEIRGEVFISHKDFKEMNKIRLKNGEQPFSNPRNSAAGSLRQLNPKITASRPLKIFCYAPGKIEGLIFKSQNEFLKTLPKWGFPVNPIIEIGFGISFLKKYYEKMELVRNSLDYDIDGVVFKVNSFSEQDELGTRTKSPRWAIAGKLKAQQVTTTILNIQPSIGRTGAITPVAKLHPVNVGGVVVSNATLHNQDEIDRKDIRIGDTVLIQRAGDVIPEIVRAILDKRSQGSKKYKLPNFCPVCNHKVNQSKDEAILRCQNMACPAQVKGRIQHFVSKRCMDIDGFGEKLVDQLVEKGLIVSVADIFKITQEQLASLDRMGKKSADNIMKAIENSKKTSFSRFLHALGIRNVGENSGKILARAFSGDLQKLQQSNLKELTQIHEIGEVMAQSIVNFFSDPINIHLIQACIDSGISFKTIKKIKPSGITEKIFVFTGSLLKFTRKEAQEMVEALGARASGSVSKKTDYVVSGPGAGSKLDSAHLLKINVLTEEEFLAMIKKLNN